MPRGGTSQLRRGRTELSAGPDTVESTSKTPRLSPARCLACRGELALIRPDNATAPPVIVLGDDETVRRCEQLTARAEPRSATIAAMFAFASGAPASHDHLTEVEAVVAAVARAIATRLPIWMPDPLADLGREQHYRRLSLVLQRHGLDLLVGHDFWPVPDAGGINEIDHALRCEVQAVDALDRAALAAAGVESLERVVAQAATAMPVTPHENDWPPTLPGGVAMARAPPGPPRLCVLAGRGVRSDSRSGRAGAEFVGSTRSRRPRLAVKKRDGVARQPLRLGSDRMTTVEYLSASYSVGPSMCYMSATLVACPRWPPANCETTRPACFVAFKQVKR